MDRSMPWLVFPAAVDLANTVVVTGSGHVDLLTTDEELSFWAAVERGRVPGVEATSGRLDDVRQLRDHVRSALFAAAAGEALPAGDVAALNGASAEALSHPELRGTDRVEDVLVSDNPFGLFRAAVARSAMAIWGEPTGPGSTSARLRAAGCCSCAGARHSDGAAIVVGSGTGSQSCPQTPGRLPSRLTDAFVIANVSRNEHCGRRETWDSRWHSSK